MKRITELKLSDVPLLNALADLPYISGRAIECIARADLAEYPLDNLSLAIDCLEQRRTELITEANYVHTQQAVYDEDPSSRTVDFIERATRKQPRRKRLRK